MTTIADSARQAGIVGAGGAGFPTHVKLAGGDATIHTVIANGVECEPLLRCDKAVMRAHTEEVVTGLQLLAEATGAQRAVIGLKGHYRDVVDRVAEVARRCGVEVFELDNYYPAGDEQVLVNEVTGAVVPEGGIPLQVGVVVNNVLTLSQLARAVAASEPVTRRVLTVAGEVARPRTVSAPIGAQLSDVIAACGGATVGPFAVIEGGPMMGQVVDVARPVTKCTSGLIVLAADHPLVLRKTRSARREIMVGRAACCSCRMCTDLCPRYNLGHEIFPHLAMRSLVNEGMVQTPPDHITAAYLCCLCGVCEVFACTMDLSPRRLFGQLREQLGAAGVRNPHQRSDLQPLDFQKRRRVPLPRLIARLGLTEYLTAPDEVDLSGLAVESVSIQMRQHIGTPATPVVQVGDFVSRGDLVGEIPEGKLGARQHASIAGHVAAVDERQVVIERGAR